MRLIFLVLSKRVIFPNFRVEFTQKKFYEIGSWPFKTYFTYNCMWNPLSHSIRGWPKTVSSNGTFNCDQRQI